MSNLFGHCLDIVVLLCNDSKTNIMKLSKKAIEKLQDRGAVLALALALGFTEVWIERLINRNKDNGHLTTVKALECIRKETGLTDTEILEETEVVQK